MSDVRGTNHGHSGDDLEGLLRSAFDAKTHAAVPEYRAVPPLRSPDEAPASVRAPRTRLLAPALSVAALVVAIAVGLLVVYTRPTHHGLGAAAPTPGHPTLAAPSASFPASTSAPPPATAVHVSSGVISDGEQVGIGMPIIVFLSRPIDDAHGFARATRVTVNGKPVHGGWYFERRYADPGHPIEADFRLRTTWPARAKIHLALPVRGMSAGDGLHFGNNLSLTFSTGPDRIVKVYQKTHQLSVLDNGRVMRKMHVSLGSPSSPTLRGTKVIMEKSPSVCMHSPTLKLCGVKYAQRLTYGGEFLFAAPWNEPNIRAGVDSSNGCTNLMPSDARTLYGLLEIGDIVEYPDASGPKMQLGQGYGDWNVPWSEWRTGGLYKVT